MKILVTGGAGFLGSHLTEALIRARHQVLVVDDLSSGIRTSVPKAARLLKLDIRSPKLRSACVNFAPDYVCHLAAQVSVVKSVADPAEDASVNVVGSLQVASAALAAHARKLLFVSSAAVYGNPSQLPTPETSPLQPSSPYALAKATVERYLGYLAGVGLPSVVVRPANVYGPRQQNGTDGGVVALFARQVLEGRNLELTGRGTQTRDFVYVTDVAAGMVKALEVGRGMYNLASGNELSVRELAVALGQVAGTIPKVTYVAPRSGDLDRSCLDASRAQQELAWEAQVPLTEGLRLTLKWAREQLAR